MLRKHTLFLIVISLIMLLAISCDMDSLSDSDMMALYGEWESPVMYSGYSDKIYDYGMSFTITIDMDRMMNKTTRSFIKLRTEKEWSHNQSVPIVESEPYQVKVYPTYSLEGYIELYDTKTFEKVSRLDYTFSEDRNTLTLKDDKTNITYSRVTKEE